MNAAQDLADRYVAVWNETDAGARRQAIAKLWIPEGRHFVGAREVQGHEELEKRIVGSHEKNVQIGKNRFRAVENAKALRDAVTFNWEMISPAGEVAAIGLEFLIVDDEQRIVTDYQFIVK